jgi:hypothetical protein
VAFFVDFVKALDRVPRDVLSKVLGKLGVPDKLVRLTAVLHDKVVARLDGKDAVSTNGVRQGYTLGPILFLFCARAMNVSWAAKRLSPSCKFLTTTEVTADNMHGQKGSKGVEFAFDRSTRADDAKEALPDRACAVVDSPAQVGHFARFDMAAQVGHFARFDMEARSKAAGSDDSAVSKSVCALLSKNQSQCDDCEKGKFKWVDKLVKSTGETKRVKRCLKCSQHGKFGDADESPIVVGTVGSTVHFVKHFTFYLLGLGLGSDAVGSTRRGSADFEGTCGLAPFSVWISSHFYGHEG